MDNCCWHLDTDLAEVIFRVLLLRLSKPQSDYSDNSLSEKYSHPDDQMQVEKSESIQCVYTSRVVIGGTNPN